MNMKELKKEITPNGLKKRPECATPNCTNDGYIMFGTEFICGDCFNRILQIQNERQGDVLKYLGEEIKNDKIKYNKNGG